MQKFINSQTYKDMKMKYEKEYFKIQGKYAWYDGDKITIKTPAEISEYFKNKKVKVSTEKENNDGEITTITKEKTFYQVWSEDEKMREYKEVIFECDQKHAKDYQFNLFDGFSIKDYKIKDKKLSEDGLKAILKHVDILCSHKSDSVKALTYFLAQALQQPHILPNCCLVIISKEGTGKDIFFDAVFDMMGGKYCLNVDKLDSVVGKFNSAVGGKLLCVINETDPVDSHQRREHIKYAVTAKKRLIEGKYKDPIESKNFCRMTFLSNRLTAFPVEEGARRPVIIYASPEMLPKYCGADKSKQYFDTLGKYIANKDVLKAFYEYLMSFDISTFNLKNLDKSELHKQLEDVAKPPVAEFLYEFVSSTPLKSISMKTTDLLAKYNEFLKKNNMKFDSNMKSFTTEVMHGYKIQKYRSSGYAKFKIDVEELKTFLVEEHKYNFDDDNEEDDENDKNDQNYDNGVKKQDLSVKMTIEEQIKYHRDMVRKLEMQLLTDVTKAYETRKVSSKNFSNKVDRKLTSRIDEAVKEQRIMKHYDTKDEDIPKENIISINFKDY